MSAAAFLSLLLTNIYTWPGGQGYCSFEFAVHEGEREYSNVEIVLRPQFDPKITATGNPTLDDQTLTIESIGGARVNSATRVSIETDCGITGFDIVRASARENGRKVDLLKRRRLQVEIYKSLPVSIKGK